LLLHRIIKKLQFFDKKSRYGLACMEKVFFDGFIKSNIFVTRDFPEFAAYAL